MIGLTYCTLNQKIFKAKIFVILTRVATDSDFAKKWGELGLKCTGTNGAHGRHLTAEVLTR